LLRLLKTSSPLSFILLVIITALLRIIIFLTPPAFPPEFTQPLGKLLIYLLQWIPLESNLVQNLFASILSISEAVYFSRILTKHKIIPRGSSPAAYCFLFLSSLFTGFLYLSPALVANLFLLIALDKLFVIYHHEKMSSKIFDLGFVISLASLFYFPALAFVAFLIIGLATIRPVRINEYLVLFTGAVVPYFLTGVYLFWNDSLGDLFRNITLYKIHKSEFSFINDVSILTLVLSVSAICGWAIHVVQINYFKTVVQIRNYFVVLFWFAVMGFLSVFLSSSLNVVHFIWLIIPAAAAISYAIPEIRRKWIGEIVHLVLLLLIIYFQYQTLF